MSTWGAVGLGLTLGACVIITLVGLDSGWFDRVARDHRKPRRGRITVDTRAVPDHPCDVPKVPDMSAEWVCPACETPWETRVRPDNARLWVRGFRKTNASYYRQEARRIERELNGGKR